MGKAGPDTAPNEGFYDWEDRGGKVHEIPKGLDPGWAYNPGEAATSFKPELSKYPPELRGHLKAHLQGLKEG